MSIQDDIEKTRKRPMAEIKMRDLLTKLRKGATATLTFGKVVQVLETLGWQVESVLGWTPRHYVFQGRDQLVDADTRHYTLEGLNAFREKLVASEVDALPDAPTKVDDVVVMDVGEVQEGNPAYGPPIYYFYRKEWVGTEGLSVTSPSGREQIFLIDHHVLGRGIRSLAADSSAPSDMWRALKQMGVEDDVNAMLGTEKHVPAAERTRENTGTCAACWGNYKLTNGRLVLHGYGYVKGQCFGVGYEPLEVSDEAAHKYRDFLAGLLEHEKEKLSKLESGEVEAIQSRYGGKTVKKGDPTFHNLLGQSIEASKNTIKQLGRDLETYDKIIASWKPRPMPREGELQRGIGFFLK